jgi:hypothetical protein
MSDIALNSAPVKRVMASRILLRRMMAVARVLLADTGPAVLWPLIIMGAAFVINVLVFAAIGDDLDEPTTGALVSIYVVQFVVCWQGLYQFFSFAVGLNASRRSVYAATVLVTVGQSVFFGLLLYGFAIIERATGGWGINLSFFDPLPITSSASPVTVLVYAVPMVAASCLGLFCGAVSRRWGGTGVFVFVVIEVLLVGGAIALITLLEWWPAIFAWYADQSGLSLTIGWPLILVAGAAVGGYAVLRRATP